jgi:hypothetical protein
VRKNLCQVFPIVVSLWACFIEDDTYLRALESHYDIHVEEALVMADLPKTATDPRQNGLSAVRSFSLYALYNFCKGQYEAGVKYANFAVFLSRQFGLHQVRSLLANGSILPDEKNRHGRPLLQECIQAHWQVFYLVACWSVATGRIMGEPDPSTPSNSLRIDTPWPHSDPLVVQVSTHIISA